jgi:uncharacterized repeat protein (TIGR02543 family)
MLIIAPAALPPSPSSANGLQPAACVCTFTINEKGLPNGTVWTGIYIGNHTTVNTTSITWPTSNGTYNWTVLPTSFSPGGSDWPEWAPTPARGTVEVFSHSVVVNVTFLRAWTITFTETGLPSGTNWTTRLLAWGSTPSTNRNSTNNYFRYPLSNGTYSFEVFTVQGAYGVRYVPTVSDYGPIKMKGANITETVNFTTQYALNTSASPPVGGSASPASGWYPAGGLVQLGETPSNGYDFTGWVGTGLGSYTGPNDSASITMSGPINETAHFYGAPFNVTFTETGLPAGTKWSVTLNGTLNSSTTSSVGFAEVNNTYAFSIGAVAGFSASPSTGSVTVDGGAVVQPIVFSAIVIPSYDVTFVETGLPSGTSWSVTLNGHSNSSTATSIGFTEINGSYAFTVSGVAGFTVAPGSGTVVVNGTPVSQSIAFTAVPPATYTITVTESGLPSGTNWSVSIGGSHYFSTSAVISMVRVNGSYTVNVTAIAGYLANHYALVAVVDGAGVSLSVTWTQVTYTVTFTETGLPTGTSWIVVVGGITHSATTSNITVTEPNGSYAFNITNVSGYTVTPFRGTVTVNGAVQTETIAFTAISSSSSSSISTTEWILIVVAIVIVAAGLLGVAMRRRRRPPPPSPQPPPP